MGSFTSAFAVSFSLILAIGAQNAFVLKQGLRNEHVFLVCLTCALSDAVLIIFGVSGFNELEARFSWLGPLMRYGGAVFLFWYGAKSFYAAWSSSTTLSITETPSNPLGTTLTTCLAFTWLNPHVYLDTVALIGSISTQYPGDEVEFAFGASTASFVFFFALGYGASFLSPIFSNPISWRILEVIVGVVMWSICARLIWMH